MKRHPLLFFLLVCLSMALACATPLSTDLRITQAPTLTVPPTVTPTLPAASSPTIIPTPSEKPATLWVDPMLPESLRQQVQVALSAQKVDNAKAATLHLGVAYTGEGTVPWVYALVAPFPTVQDNLQIESVRRFWRGEGDSPFQAKPLLISPGTRAVFEAVWGKAANSSVEVVEENHLLERAWSEKMAWALIPFEQIGPRWKVFRLDGISPLEHGLNEKQYPLVIRFGLVEGKDAQVRLPATNRDEQRLTTLVMSGTTALVRALAARMEKNGFSYPGEKIKYWLRSADLTHVSNEVSFYAKCPPPNPFQTSLMFCSKPEYLDLFSYVGVDIIELSGNHLMDTSRQSLVDSFQLFQERKFRYYAAGMNLAEARRPLLVEDHGNKLAFLGCNAAGPASVWASANDFGVASCDYEEMKGEIQRLRSDGYLPIVTLQHYEYYNPNPAPLQKRDFVPLAEAGAVIVSGSQSHYPQGFGMIGDSLIHYGLGNLFFDQMRVPTDGPSYPAVFNEKDLPIAGTRLEFIDRHVFYNGKYIGTELLTAVLEDFAQPTPMTDAERAVFLRDVFATSEWGQ